jgi:hypothetical protein
MSTCRGIVGALFGHKFVARFSEGRPTLTRVDAEDARVGIDMVRVSKPLTYHGDICERCGEVISGPTAG